MSTENTALNIRLPRKDGLLFKLIARHLGMSYGEVLAVLSRYYYENELRDHKKCLSKVEQELQEIDDAAKEAMDGTAA